MNIRITKRERNSKLDIKKHKKENMASTLARRLKNRKRLIMKRKWKKRIRRQQELVTGIVEREQKQAYHISCQLRKVPSEKRLGFLRRFLWSFVYLTISLFVAGFSTLISSSFQTCTHKKRFIESVAFLTLAFSCLSSVRLQIFQFGLSSSFFIRYSTFSLLFPFIYFAVNRPLFL